MEKIKTLKELEIGSVVSHPYRKTCLFKVISKSSTSFKMQRCDLSGNLLNYKPYRVPAAHVTELSIIKMGKGTIDNRDTKFSFVSAKSKKQELQEKIEKIQDAKILEDMVHILNARIGVAG